MKKRFFFCWFIIYVINSFTGYLIHHVILGSTYKAIAPTLHADVINRLWAFILISITGSFFFTLIYGSWQKKHTVFEGLKYGFFIGLWMALSTSLTAYAASELIPLSLALEWIAFAIIQYSFSGAVLAFVYNYHLREQLLKHAD